MAKTLAELLAGEDMEGGEAFCDGLYNLLKNHWRADYTGDPCGELAGEVAGMIISDEHDEKLWHVQAASCEEIIQTATPVGDDKQIIIGDDSDILIYYDEAGNDELMIEARNAAATEGVTVSLLETNQQFRIRQNADIMSFYLTTTDAYMKWSDGALTLQTDEGANTLTQINIKPKGTSNTVNVDLYDTGSTELRLYTGSNRGFVRSISGALGLQQNTIQDILVWEAIASGNPNFQIYGYITAGATRRYSRFRMDDTNDEFEIEAEDNANHEGITVLIPEANQRFRVRGASRAERFWVDEDGLVGWRRQGELFQWTYQGDLADDATFNLPTITDSCWGFIQAGNNEEYAIFTIDDDGDVTLISNSANVVANVDIDGNLVLGTAATQEPLVIRNRLGAQKNINLIIWYS